MEGEAKSKAKTLKGGSSREASLKQKSPAEFFSENKNIAGFDNPGKSLYTTVRELVENALDSAESISELPVVEVTIEEISRSKFNNLIGLTDRERVDAELYDDFETAKAREKRLAKEAKEQEKQAKIVAAGKKIKEVVKKVTKSRGESSLFKVSCKDNGRGMAHDDIPNMLGRVLSGTKYGLRQTRGKFGLGAKMALIWAKMSTGLPIDVTASTKGQSFISHCVLDIDIHKNVPHIHLHEKKENLLKWHGAEIEVTIEGNWTTYRSKIISYMRQMAVITPYAEFLFRFVTESPDKNVTIRFRRRTDVMPPPPAETKYHPSAVDLLLIKRLISETSKQNLVQFLQHDFTNISKSYAERLIGEMGSEFSPKLSVKSLTDQQIVRIHQLFRQAKFDEPSGELAIQQCCSQLKAKISRQQAALDKQERKRTLAKYIPGVSRAIYDTLLTISEHDRSKRRKYAEEYDEVVQKVASREITEATLRQKLTQHVDQMDVEMALEYATQSGMMEAAREAIFLNCRDQNQAYVVDMKSPVCVFRMFAGFGV